MIFMRLYVDKLLYRWYNKSRDKGYGPSKRGELFRPLPNNNIATANNNKEGLI